MDIHRSFAQVAILENGQITREFRVDLVQGPLVNFAKTLDLEDEVVIEATGNSAAVERLMRPHVKRVAVANSRLVRAIAYARVKTDKIDAAILARLHAAGFLPEVWVADEDTLSRRRRIAERMGVLEQVVRTKGRIQAILNSNLIPRYSGHLFGKAGRNWLDSLALPDEERAMLGRLIIELERVSTQMAHLDRALAQQALDDPRARQLMTIPGISSVVATTVLASIGDVSRFPTPQKLSSYFGLTPKVRQSGDQPARHGRISKQGNGDARKMLVEAAWSAKTAPGPLRAFFVRIQHKRGAAAAAVATARKLAVMIWHVLSGGSEYIFARPAFTAMKLRKVALKAGAPREYGKAGPGRDYWIKEIRHKEMDYVERVERAYERMVEAWREKPRKSAAG
ncbi:IS110 family transposase [Bosea sp. (in: a-proteobacteria)]|uniref:IS110 family transposase n=1 Tax=Bosea sp. (in: a-proteobacteria) TaxID=1871050 RepID=UPI002732DE4E|nr:IS110 family transposase [Bosea sp. (in: a-proteobacteria)]MDP3410159.1 IS110 family transposase [Bosea sp. (in: a-proteobacteria)]